MSGIEMAPPSSRRESGPLLGDDTEDLEYKMAPEAELKGPGGRYLAGDVDDGLVVKKKKRRKPRVAKQKKVEITLEHIERRLAKSFVVKTEKKSCKDVRISIDPRDGFMRRWDVVMILCLMFTALVTPYEIAFLAEESEKSTYEPLKDWLFWVNRMVDFLFFVDMIINFFLGFFDEDEGQWVFENKRIVLRYVRYVVFRSIPARTRVTRAFIPLAEVGGLSIWCPSSRSSLSAVPCNRTRWPA